MRLNTLQDLKVNENTVALPMVSPVKVSLYNYCLQYAEERINRMQDEIRLQQEAANEETKSSAGDKYETGRAMAQLEIERNTVQLKEAEKLKSFLLSAERHHSNDMVVHGSLVTTSKGIFYLAISLGVVTHQGQTYLIVSPDSPIGKLLMGKRTGEEMIWRNESYRILNIE